MFQNGTTGLYHFSFKVTSKKIVKENVTSYFIITFINSLDTVLQFANITEKSIGCFRWYDVFCITPCDRHPCYIKFLITHFYGI